MTLIFTIGIYEKTEEEFFRLLVDHQIDLFVDIRRRRGLRGPTYRFGNSRYLQKRLAELNIKYLHILDLAPTDEMRQAQGEDDVRAGTTQRKREKLGKSLIQMYESDILAHFDAMAFLEQYADKQIAFFCVEASAAACHRGLVAREFEKLNVSINHL